MFVEEKSTLKTNYRIAILRRRYGTALLKQTLGQKNLEALTL
jgi:hypothetical protein